jgi:hypothetical protein
MINVFSWKWWVIMALALGTLACNREARRERADERYAARLERAEQRRLEREAGRDQGEPRLTARERAEQRRAARAERQEQRRAQREQPAEREPRAQPEPPAQSLAASPPAAAVEPLARVVFMRVSKQTSGVEATLFDVSTPEPKLIGTVSAASKLTHSFRAGTYTFMVVGETAEFMEATLAEGKTYYALIIPKSGAKRFALEPVRRDELVGKEFQGWDRGTRPMPAGAKGQPPADASEKRVRHWQEWLKKPDSQKATLTLNAEDGR